MKESLLREISEKYLRPFFSGAKIEVSSVTSSPRESRVSFISPQLIEFKVNRRDAYRLQIRRDQPFSQKDGEARETKVIDAFVSILSTMEDELDSHLKDDLLSTFQRRVVARAVADVLGEKSLLAVIDQMAAWATRLYEGAPISSAIGIASKGRSSSGLSLNDIAENDFGAVLSNGFDTLLEFDGKLGFLGHRVLQPGVHNGKFYPWRHSAIADWTEADSGRIAVVLNRVGEILIFRQGQLLFARRGGKWHFLTHAPVVGQMFVPRTQLIRTAIYETALDASFARTGACIGVVSAGAAGSWENVVNETDWLSNPISPKAKAIAQIVNELKFQDLDRTLRQELVAIDGATVIDHLGTVLAVGAILKIKGGSTGGGRTAAAKQLGELGLGLKVSQDGGITGFRPDTKAKKANTVRAAFSVM